MYNGARFGKSAIKLSFFGQPQEEWGKGKGGGGGGVGRIAPILSLELSSAADLQESLLGGFGADVDVD